MSTGRLFRASSLFLRQTRPNGGLTAPFPTTKRLCPLLASSNLTSSSSSSLSSPLSPFSLTLAAAPISSSSPFSFRAYTTSLEDDSGLSEEDSFSSNDEDSDNPFDTSDDDWVKEQDSDIEESELELGGRTIPAKHKPYPTLETNYLIRSLKKQLEKGAVGPQEGERLRDIAKEFAASKNDEELNKTIDALDEAHANAAKESAKQQIQQMEELRDFKIKENARLAALPKPFDWTPDINDTGPVYDPARSGFGVFPPILAPIEEVADFYLRLYPSLYPFRDVIVYKMMLKVVEVNDWYEKTIPQYSEIIKRAKDLGIFEHFAGLEDEESVVREIAASQGLTLEEWGNAAFQIKALKHQRAACFWDPPFDGIVPTMQDLEDLVTALENEHPGERPIVNLETAILNSEDASDACARFVENIQQLNNDIKSLNILPRQYAVQMENMIYPGMYEGHLAYQDWRHNPWVQEFAAKASEKEHKAELEAIDRLMGRLPSFVHVMNEKLESLQIPEDAIVVGENGERTVDPEKGREQIKSFIEGLSQTEVVELTYMLSQPKQSKERRCLNYLSSFFDKNPVEYNGQTLHSDTALMYLMNRQKEILRIKKLQKDQENPFTNFENYVGIEGYKYPDPTPAGLESGEYPPLKEEEVNRYNGTQSAFAMSLTRSEAQHLINYGITLEEAQDNVIDEAMIEVEEEMKKDSSNIEDGFEWDRVLTEQRLAQSKKTEKLYESHMDKSWRNRFPGTLLDAYRDQMERDDVLIDRKRLKKNERNCIFCVMENPPALEPWNVPFLRDLVDEVGNIRSRRETGFCPKHQRKIAPVLGRAVQLGFFSYKKGDFTVIDPFRPMPWKPVQHGLYPEDIMEALEGFDEEEAEQFLDLYKAETKDTDPVEEMEEIESTELRYVPGNLVFRKRIQ